MNLEIGERVIFRSLQWEVQDNSSESYVELFGRGRENQGRVVRVVLGVEPIERAEMPGLTWTLGGPWFPALGMPTLWPVGREPRWGRASDMGDRGRRHEAGG